VFWSSLGGESEKGKKIGGRGRGIALHGD